MTHIPAQPPPEQVTFLQTTIIAWENEHRADFPWRHTDNPWHALVAEIMLQRTRAEQVVPAFKTFCEKYPAPRDYLADENAHAFETLGLQWREQKLKSLARILTDSPIPTTHRELVALPGVGDYVASAFLSLHIGVRHRIIDSNVVRLYGRFFGFDTHPETRREKAFITLADHLTPEDDFTTYNYGLLDFTRAVCKPLPECESCPLSTECKYITNT